MHVGARAVLMVHCLSVCVQLAAGKLFFYHISLTDPNVIILHTYIVVCCVHHMHSLSQKHPLLSCPVSQAQITGVQLGRVPLGGSEAQTIMSMMCHLSSKSWQCQAEQRQDSPHSFNNYDVYDLHERHLSYNKLRFDLMFLSQGACAIADNSYTISMWMRFA